MPGPRFPALFGLVLVATAPLVAGCTPKIGDDCETSLDCSAQGDRLCDTTQPGGYCTIFNCEPGTCPEDESSCVAFYNQLDPACGLADDGEWPRFERSFCMQRCEDDSDCRSDYECVDGRDRGALIVDADEGFGVCLVRITSSAATASEVPPQTCLPRGEDPPLTPYDGGGGAGGG